MTSLSEFSDEQRVLLASLLYKVGIWISHADDTEGDRDDDLEERALEQIITEVSKHHEDMPFVHQIAQLTLSSKDKWPVWADYNFHVLDECKQAMTLLTSRVEERIYKNYRKTLLEIAQTVAEASGEFAALEEDPKGFSALVGKVTGMLGGGNDESHAMNISAAEDSSLAQLAEALDD